MQQHTSVPKSYARGDAQQKVCSCVLSTAPTWSGRLAECHHQAQNNRPACNQAAADGRQHKPPSQHAGWAQSSECSSQFATFAKDRKGRPMHGQQCKRWHMLPQSEAPFSSKTSTRKKKDASRDGSKSQLQQESLTCPQNHMDQQKRNTTLLRAQEPSCRVATHNTR